MSGFMKSLGKVFKKVVKVVKKVLPIALIGAAAIFTGGAALGLPFAAGGFGGAIGGLVSSLGLSGPMAGVLTSAVTKAGIGGLTGLALGGKKGMKQGLMAGAAMGLLGGGAPAGAATPAGGQVISPASANAGDMGVDPSTGHWGVDVNTGGTPGMPAPAVGVGGGVAAAQAGGGGLMGLFGGNQTLASQALQGLGNGLMARSQARADERARDKESANYTADSNLIGSFPSSGGNFDQNTKVNWTFDPRQGKLVRTGG